MKLYCLKMFKLLNEFTETCTLHTEWHKIAAKSRKTIFTKLAELSG